MPEYKTSSKFSTPNNIEERPDYGKLLEYSNLSFKEIPPEHLDTALCYYAMLVEACDAEQIPKHLWSYELYDIAYEKNLINVVDIPEEYLSLNIALACIRRNVSLQVFPIEKLLGYTAEQSFAAYSKIRKIVSSLQATGLSSEVLVKLLKRRPELFAGFFDMEGIRLNYIIVTSADTASKLLFSIIEDFKINLSDEEEVVGAKLLRYVISKLLDEARGFIPKETLVAMLEAKDASVASSYLYSDLRASHYLVFDQLHRFDYDPNDIVNTIRKKAIK